MARLTGPVSLLEKENGSGSKPSEQGHLVRPDWVWFGGDVPGVVIHVRYRGPHTDYTVEVMGGTMLVRETGRTGRRPGESVGISIHRTWPFSSG